jgi:hypothetical protein
VERDGDGGGVWGLAGEERGGEVELDVEMEAEEGLVMEGRAMEMWMGCIVLVGFGGR